MTSYEKFLLNKTQLSGQFGFEPPSCLKFQGSVGRERTEGVSVIDEMESAASAVVGDWLIYYPNALGVLLQTGFKQFESLAGIHGLAKEHDLTLEILAVIASAPGSGQFRRFIEFLKQSDFETILIWEVYNPDLAKTLKRYGFKRTHRTEADGEELSGFKWVNT